VEKTYPNGFKALRGLTAGVERGEMMGLLGPNGAGKSTTFNLLTSAQKVSAGRVLLKQQNIYSQN
jgi:ABC-type multidrug transport system ATPase subunit